MWSQFPPNLSCLQNNLSENNVEPVPANLSCLRINPPENNVELVHSKFMKQSAGKQCGASSLQIWAASKTICWKIMWNQFRLNLSCLQNNLPENNVEPVPRQIWAASKTICRKKMWSQFMPNFRCLQNNPPENNVEPVPAEFELPPKPLSENNVEPVPAKSELPPKQSAGK